ncbi:MAG: GGDEF domain-containing protein [Magnetovibrio sp.]|nr:GGDEF domain-containing protein [Magnetovibrio sp.]
MHIFRHTTAALAIGFSAILICMLASIYIGFQHLDQTRDAWQRDALFREKVRASFLMREAIRERSFHLTFATSMSDYFDRDEQREIYNFKAINFMVARDKLIELHMTPLEKSAMNDLMQRIGELRPSIDRAMDLVVENGNTFEALHQMTVALSGQSGVIEEINNFIRVVEGQSRLEAINATREIDDTQFSMLILSGCAVALAAIIGIMVLIRESRHMRRLRRHRDELAQLSTTDALTCIANRRRFDEFLEFEWARAVRSNSSLSLVMLDIDHFKNFNDTYGHAAGDTCLMEVAKAMCGVIVRATDLLARYGGEEFACILPETGGDGAYAIAEKLRTAVAGLKLKHEDSSAADHITVSIGIATTLPQPHDDISKLFEVADANLYKAKEQGRNRVVSASDPMPSQETFQAGMPQQSTC